MKSIFQTLLFLSCLPFFALAQTADSGYKVGDMATDFSLKNVNGKMVSLKDYKEAKGIILIFTCNHCPFSVAYEDRIIALHHQYASKGFPVVAINSDDPEVAPDDSYELMIERAKDKKFPFVYLYDETQEYARTYGATKTPHVFLLTKNAGQFQVAYIGAIDDNSNEPELVKTKYLERALDEVLQGKPVSQPFTKAVGCSIKWRKKM
jgi:peroxiredoxin